MKIGSHLSKPARAASTAGAPTRALGESDECPPERRPGRKPDRSKDAALLEAAVEVFSEVGFDGMTMDLVAKRAGTTKSATYRRWPSKVELILDAVGRTQDVESELGELPDTGNLRDDLVALTGVHSLERGEHRLRVMAGLASMLDREPQLAGATNAVLVEPWVDVCRLLIARAVTRGQAATTDIETVSRVIPSMTSYRLLVQRMPVDAAYFVHLIDTVLIPAVRPVPAHD